MEEAALLVRQHVPGVIAANLIHGPARISRAAGLSWENDGAETGFGEAVVLGCPYTTGVTPTAVIIAEIAVLCGQIQTTRYHRAALEAGADIQVLPLVKG